MIRERAPLDWSLLAALGIVTLDLLIAVPTVPPPPADPELPALNDSQIVEDQLYRQHRESRAIGLDPTTPPIAAFEALTEARKLDRVLGIDNPAALEARLRIVAPLAAEAYRAAGDREGAELAELTADMTR